MPLAIIVNKAFKNMGNLKFADALFHGLYPTFILKWNLAYGI
jgi:hypothetical protein